MSPLTICLIIFALTVVSYCWGKLSMATTALVSMMALVLFGCMTADEALAYSQSSHSCAGSVIFHVDTPYSVQCIRGNR